MRIISLRYFACLTLVGCVVLASSQSATPRRWSLKNANRQFRSRITSLSRSWKNETISALHQVAERANPVKQIRNRFGLTKKKTYNPSDPLHAYPNSFDLLVHNLFQRASRYEVNNSESVRTALRMFRISTYVSFLATVAGAIITLATASPAAVIALGRREDEHGDNNEEETSSPTDWNFVNYAAQSVLQAIQNGQLRYEL